jgi:OmpA-OmpF porin, OOP family
MRRRLITLTALLLPSSALAQEGGNIDLQAFRPAMDSRGFITVNASQVLGRGEPSFGLVTTWGRGLLRFEEGGNTYEVENVITPTLVAAVGVPLPGIELEIGGALPFAIMSGDRQPDSDAGTPSNPNDDESYRFDGQGTGDASLHLKWRLRAGSRPPGIGAALIASVSFPTASEENRWLGDEGVVPQLIAVLDHEIGRFRLAANGGVRWRSGSRFVDDEMTGPAPVPLTGGVIEAGTSAPFGLGASYAVVPERFEAVTEVFGAVPLAGENYFPLEALGGLKLYLARNSFLSFGAGAGLLTDQGANPDLRAFLGIVFEPNIGDRDGDGLKDDVDACPDQPEDRDGFEDSDGCPELDNDRDGIPDVDDGCPLDPEDKDGFDDEDGCPDADRFDRDGDKILDDADACPDDPEDHDGFEDRDGCPDPDNDGDGILDVDDLCPDEPEDIDSFEDRDGCPETDNDSDLIRDTADACPRRDGETAKQTAEVYNTVKDEDGCPDRGPVIETRTHIEILESIHFEFNSDVIKQDSHPILRAVAKTMLLNPEIRLVEVQGHTDERGSDAYNLDLSQRRAASVMRFLAGEGVEAARLASQGYGETIPLDPGHTERAWAKNRRVEFVIVKRDGM